jgi:lipopolysaccharide transport system ATP-binding protein
MQFNPSVLVIDEVLAVGDARFQQKCLERLAAFRAAGKTLILTSHVPEQIRSLCDEVLVLEDGQIVMLGDPEDALRCYTDVMRQRTEKRAAQVSPSAAPASLAVAQAIRQGTQEATISAVELFDTRGQPINSLRSGEGMRIELQYQLARPLPDMILSLAIYSETHVKCFEAIIPSVGAAFGGMTERGRLQCVLPVLPLVAGRYYVNVGLYPTNWDYVYDYHWQMHEVWVLDGDAPTADISGVIALNPIWSIQPAA